ncbi:MAG: hypothetical protein R2822_19815 [Spirosomataceae bacterium]
MLQTIPFPELRMKGNILTGLTIRRYESFQQCPSYSQLKTPPHYDELKKWGIHLLFKQALDGSIVVGDSHEYAPASQVNDLGYHLNDYVNQLMITEAKRIVNIPVELVQSSWAGFYSQTTDEIFEYDMDENIRIITGIGGRNDLSGGYAERRNNKAYIWLKGLSQENDLNPF